MAPHAHAIYAVEKDRTLVNIFEQEFGSLENINFITADILKLDFKKDLSQAQFPLKVIGNIPYHISTPILFKLLENKHLFSCAVLTVQQEVARRILARPNTKDYGILSIMAQTQAHVRKLFDIRPTCFIPPPAVTSTVVRLDFEPLPEIRISNWELFQKLVKAAFGQRRKTLRNALRGARGLNIPEAIREEAFKTCHIDPSRRPETLLIDEYIKLANHLALAIKP